MMKNALVFLLVASAAVFLSAETALAQEGGAEPIKMASVLKPGEESLLLPPAPQRLDVVAAKHIPSGSILAREDLQFQNGDARQRDAFAVTLIGKEVKRTLYAGQTITARDIGLPTLVRRNELIAVEYRKGPLLITTEARVLDDGAKGDIVRFMNLSSKNILSGVVLDANRVSAQ